MIHRRQALLAQSAKQLGISVEDLTVAWSQDALRYSTAGHEEVVFEGNGLGSTSLLATTICSDLPITRHMLGQLGIPSPAFAIVRVPEEGITPDELKAQLGGFWGDGATYLVRPAFEQSGHAVGANIRDIGAVERHLDLYADDYATWMVEEQYEGEELQLLVVGGQLVSGILRSPLRLVGDGVKTLEELIAAHNADCAPGDTIEIDADTRQLLREQSVFLSEAVPSGQAVVMKSAGSGGASDVTERLHRRYGEWAATIAARTGLRCMAIHCKTSRVDGDPSTSGTCVSLDARPDWLTWLDAEGGRKDIPELILKAVFGMR